MYYLWHIVYLKKEATKTWLIDCNPLSPVTITMIPREIHPTKSRTPSTTAATRHNRNNQKLRISLAILLTLSFLSILLDIDLHLPSSHSSLRRSLQTASKLRYLGRSHSALLPYAHHNLRRTKLLDGDATPLFWHIPKSGGTTAKRLYDCLGLTLANRLGADPKYGLHDKDEIVVFRPFDSSSSTGDNNNENNNDNNNDNNKGRNVKHAKFVNVDTTTEQGILRAERLGLVPSRKADIIFSSDVSFASDHLFDQTHRGRILALFRHPIDRLVSKFYYLQTATWERTYRPEWKDITLLEWAEKVNGDENFLVKKIVGKKLNQKVDLGDLIVAREIVDKTFVVGLMEDMEESVRRFNKVLGIDDEGDERNRVCMEEFFGKHQEEDDVTKNDKARKVTEADESATPNEDKKGGKANANKFNSHAHPKVRKKIISYF
ncbi:hypothetical protein ACHAXS_003089 [Conticribra weissflogii]